jgi:PhzF family phenazine biosynthesis protein
MSSADMQDVARRFGRESGFVFSPKSGDYDFSFRFFVPNHKMEMCGHATIGALWVLMRQGRLPADTVRIETRSGPVTGFVTVGSDGQPAVEITQPAGKVVPLRRDEEAEVLLVLGIGREALAPLPVHNAVTSRVKTLIPINDRERLNKLVTSASDVEAVCRRIGSTGLYPYSTLDAEARTFEARQFPRSSGYPEDAATGIAAAALVFGLLNDRSVAPDDRLIRVLQGRAMGRLSEIRVRVGFADGRAVGCLLGGRSRRRMPPCNPMFHERSTPQCEKSILYVAVFLSRRWRHGAVVTASGSHLDAEIGGKAPGSFR